MMWNGCPNVAVNSVFMSEDPTLTVMVLDAILIKKSIKDINSWDQCKQRMFLSFIQSTCTPRKAKSIEKNVLK